MNKDLWGVQVVSGPLKDCVAVQPAKGTDPVWMSAIHARKRIWLWDYKEHANAWISMNKENGGKLAVVRVVKASNQIALNKVPKPIQAIYHGAESTVVSCFKQSDKVFDIVVNDNNQSHLVRFESKGDGWSHNSERNFIIFYG